MHNNYPHYQDNIYLSHDSNYLAKNNNNLVHKHIMNRDNFKKKWNLEDQLLVIEEKQ